MAPQAETSTAPGRAGLVLISLILVAAVANLNLAVANVALPDIGKAFDAGQTALNLVAVGYSLGLAASVLYFGAIGDRFGRKRMLLLGIPELEDPGTSLPRHLVFIGPCIPLPIASGTSCSRGVGSVETMRCVICGSVSPGKGSV